MLPIDRAMTPYIACQKVLDFSWIKLCEHSGGLVGRTDIRSEVPPGVTN